MVASLQKDKKLPISFDRGSTDPKNFYVFSSIITPQTPKPPSVEKVIYIYIYLFIYIHISISLSYDSVRNYEPIQMKLGIWIGVVKILTEFVGQLRPTSCSKMAAILELIPNSNKIRIYEPIWMKLDINKVFIKSSNKFGVKLRRPSCLKMAAT